MSQADSTNPIKPTPVQIENSIRWGWEYDSTDYTFIKDDVLGFYSEAGFQKI